MQDLADRIRAVAYLEGDFVLRSGRRSSFYLDKYRFETQPSLLREIGDLLAQRIAEVEPNAQRIAGPELGAVALAAAASMAANLPFLIVRREAKDYGTSNRLEGICEEGERVVVVEDVVTSGGAQSTHAAHWPSISGCVCASTKPGSSVRPPRSNSTDPWPAASRHSSSEPTWRMRSSRTATASARISAPIVRIGPPEMTVRRFMEATVLPRP